MLDSPYGDVRLSRARSFRGHPAFSQVLPQCALWCVSQKWDMRVFWRTDTSLHGGRQRGVRQKSRLASMERASPDACLAGNSL